MSTFFNDIKYGFRMLGRNPGFTTMAVLILALGIGANTAIFSVVNAVMLRPLPYTDAHRLVMLCERTGKRNIEIFTEYDRFLFWREQNVVFEHMSGCSGRRPYVTGIDRPRYVWAATVLPDLFPLLGVQPVLGRGFLPDEDQPGNDRVIVLSHTFWRNDMGGTPDAIGKTMILDGKSYMIVGVMPPKFNFPLGRTRAFWVPLVDERDPYWPAGPLVCGVARLKKGGTLQQARTAMAVIADRLKQKAPESRDITVRRILDRGLRANRQLLWLLLGAAGVVLLIACTNVASLLLARAAVRQREMAMRSALGASRGRLMRQTLTESLLLSMAGGILGLLVTFCTINGIIRLCPSDIPRLMATSVDWSVLAFMLGVSVLTGIFFGVIPACRTSGVCVTRALKEGQTRSSTGRGWRHLHGGLVIAQTGLSLILLIGAALLVRTWIALQREDLGFRPENVIAVQVRLLESRYPEYDGCQPFFDPLLQRVRSLPGVRSAALTPFLDFGRDVMKSPFSIAGQIPANPDEGPFAKHRDVSSGFFETLGMRLLKGRTFTEEDMHGTTHCAVVDENLVRRHFAAIDPIGQKVSIEEADCTIVGVVSTLKDFRHLNPTVGTVFRPRNPYYRDMVLIVRTDGDPLRLAGAIRSQIAELEKDEVITEVETLKANLSDMLAPQRFSVVLLGLFAGIALTLALVGIYGLLQYSTAQQTHDIGIRMALGAKSADVLKAVLGRGLRLAILGIAVGVAGALALTRLLSSLLYGVSPTDLFTFVCVSLLLAGVALLASYIPARRAAKIDPMVALRYE
ncbi:MAG: ABC transporter permease [Phycisphaerae bacterium]|nr:ABC transporter permease [Phycisphaerae bacterium]